MEARILKEDELDKALQLLYQIYVLEMHWTPKENNASKMRLEHRDGKELLTDQFDAIATWYGLFDHDDLIGVVRTVPPVNGRLEIENYREIPTRFKKKCPIEANRLAISHNYRTKSTALFELLKIMYLTCLEREYDSIICSAPFPNPGHIHLKFGMEQIEEQPFTYDASDREMVWLLGADNPEFFKHAITFADEVIEKINRAKKHHDVAKA
jgi:Acetyltransferase (GNAT) domain